MISGEELGVKIYLSYEDERHPTIVLQSDVFGSVGYDLNLATGELGRVCICSAHSENECVCGAWDEAKLKDRNGIICDSSSQTQSSENISNKELPSEQEPAAWLDVFTDEAYSNSELDEEAKKDLTPLYTEPPKRKWVGLTDVEIDALAMDEDGLPNSHIELARAIEAKLKEKNSGL